MGAIRRTPISYLQGLVRCSGCLNLGSLQGQYGVVKPNKEGQGILKVAGHIQKTKHIYSQIFLCLIRQSMRKRVRTAVVRNWGVCIFVIVHFGLARPAFTVTVATCRKKEF